MQREDFEGDGGATELRARAAGADCLVASSRLVGLQWHMPVQNPTPASCLSVQSVART